MDKSLFESHARVPFRTVVISIVLLWAVYFALATIRWEILGVGMGLEMMRLRAIVAVAGVGVTIVLWLLLRLFDSRALWVQATAALLLAAPASVMLAQINYYVFADMNTKMEQIFVDIASGKSPPDGGPESAQSSADRNAASEREPGEAEEAGISEPDIFVENDALRGARQINRKIDLGMLSFLGPLTEIAFSRYFMMLAWCSLYYSLLAISKARLAERREQEFRNAAKAAELRSLRYQVNPHFLFNTLNSLSSLVITGKAERAEQMIQLISRFYRHSLADDPTTNVTLADEFDLQRLYLAIEAVRFPERLRSELILPPELADARVPGMILQPLIENSVRYAVSPVNRPVLIRVEAREEFDRLVITVSDDGPGVPDNVRNGFGIGLANVRDRLEARFGPDIVLESGPVPGGYRTEMRIPLTRNG
ncbi:MAG: histidine kinase [Sphingomonadales bacterium BRH_c3]|nr:MAG: histidine kinase [Sphingomonadales bacterium BRH_c3]